MKLPHGYTRSVALFRLSDAAFRLHLSVVDWLTEQDLASVTRSDLAGVPHAPHGKRLDAVLDELELARLWLDGGGAWVVEFPKEPERDLSAIRSEAGRRGGRKSAEVRRETNGTAQPRSKLEPNAEANQLASPKQSPEANSGLVPNQGPDPSSPLGLSSPDSSGFPSDSGLLAASSLNPDPEPAESFSHVGATKPKRRWRRVPADWEPTDEHRAIARERGLDFELELAKFRDHEFATAKSDASGTFRNWLRNARPTVTALAFPNRPAPGSNFERLRVRAERIDREDRERAEQEARNAAR